MKEVTATATKKKTSGHEKHGGKKGKIRHMIIKPAANGFTSEVDHQSPGNGMMGESEPPTIHPSLSHLTKHVKATFGGPGKMDETNEGEGDGEES